MDTPLADWTPADELLVTEPEAVEILWHPRKRPHLQPFLGRSSSLAQATAELKIKKSTMSYWIDRLLQTGLIRVQRVERQGRNRVPVYRAVADRLRVGLADAPFESYESLCDEFSRAFRAQSRQALAQAIARQGRHLEMLYRQDPTAGLLATVLPREGAVPEDDFVYYWARLWLTAEQQQALRAELDALWNRYEALSDRHQAPSALLMHLMAVPEAR